MVFRRFRLLIILRVLFLTGTIALGLYLLFETSYIASTIVCGLLVLYQVFALIHFLEKTRRDVAHFLSSIKYGDFTETFSPVAPRDGKQDTLREAFHEVMMDFQKVRMEHEQQYRYLQTIVQHIGSGILVYDREGRVDLVNNAAKRIFGLPTIRNIDSLSHFGPELLETLRTIGPGKRRIVKAADEDDLLQLAIDATEFRRGGQRFTLVSIQDIQRELEEKELEAWRNLMRVLTHEIRNSIAPIASLADTAEEALTSACDTDTADEDLEDIHLAIKTIRRRSSGLLQFMEPFRTLYKIPPPEFEIVRVRDLLEHIREFFKPQCEEYDIESVFEVQPETLEITADPRQIEQVLINLVLNALDVMKDVDEPRLLVTAELDRHSRPVIHVEDNGPGIQPDVLEKIFIPFFTTKKQGSGIGLALSRQIMRRHNGRIQVFSDPGVKTVFTLRF